MSGETQLIRSNRCGVELCGSKVSDSLSGLQEQRISQAAFNARR